ncbi:MAG: alginate export family protein [Ignavibacteria bacterium]|nr:alginate export family protein [Ignavibacteria bacterium]
MYKELKFILLFILIFAGYESIMSQSKNANIFSIDGNIRYRFEKWEGKNALNYGDDSPEALGKINDNILLQRIILGLNYKPKENIELDFHLQDSRAFGWSLRNSLEPDAYKIRKKGISHPYYIMNPNEVFFEIYDFNIHLRNIFKNISIKFGRQKINTADNRIFGPGEWGNSGRYTWDAIKFTYSSDKFSLDAFTGGTRVNYPYRTTLPFTYNEYYGLGTYGIYKIDKDFTLEPYLARKQQGSADYIKDQSINRNWLGLRIAHNNFHNILGEVNYAREFGRENGKDISVYGFFMKLGYGFELLHSKANISLRYTYASGGRKSDDVIRSFDPVFGSADKYYGWLNIVKWSNIDDREIVFEAFYKKNLWLEIKYNQFRIPSPEDAVINGTLKLKPGENYLGEEYDLHARYNDEIYGFALTFGYFNPKEVQEINGKPARGAFIFSLQVLYNFNFFIF